MTSDEVKDFWGDVYPELTQAVTEGPEYKDDRAEYTFHRAVGTKGNEGSRNDEMAEPLHNSKSLIIPSNPRKSAYLWLCNLFYSA
jgi:hypothetical protein